MRPRNISILGAGLVGSLLAIYLRKRGYEVTLYERRQDMRKIHMAAGRSINLALSDRGWKALEGVGIDEEIRNIGIPMYARMMHGMDGKLTSQNYGKDGQAIYAVSRGILNCTLMDLAEKEGAKIFFDERCTGLNLMDGVIHLENASNGTARSVGADLIFGADGAFSAARLQLQFADRSNYSQEYLKFGY